MTNIEIVRNYLKSFFSGKVRHTEVRRLLTDDFEFRGPMMSAQSADEYVGQLEAMGDEMELYADVREIIGQGDRVAALVDFQGPSGNMVYSQWFTLREGKIARLEVVYDPRPFISGGGED